MTDPVELVLSRLDRVSESGGQWKARCPAHEDRNPSLAVKRGDDDRALLTCHAGCATEDVVAVLGLTMADLFSPKVNGNGTGHARPAVIATRRYEVRFVDGTLRAIHKRVDYADGSKQMPWLHPDGTASSRANPIKPERLPLYRSETLAAADPADPVIVTEGEKAADAVASISSGPVVGTVTGAKHRPDTNALAALRGRSVILWPDNDADGRRHMRDVAEALSGIAAAVLIVEVPDLPPKGDAADYVAAGRTADELLELLRNAREFEDERADSEHASAASIGRRTAADLRHGLPPEQLADPFLTPEGATVIYARGGTGKTMIACWLALRLIRSAADAIVMVLDYEGHEREWGSRLRGLGATDDELGRIHYRAPFAEDWTAQTGALSTIAYLVREDAAQLGIRYLLIDSYSVATSNGDTMGGEAAAREYFSALATIALPSLTIAHVRGDSPKFPERPFGSVFVHNLARETWAVERTGDDDGETTADEATYGPNVVALELRNKKANGRRLSPSQFVTFSFYANGDIEVTEGSPGRSLAELAADALADGPLTLPKIATAIKEDTGQKVSEDTLRRTLSRHSDRFHQVPGKRPRTWELKP